MPFVLLNRIVPESPGLNTVLDEPLIVDVPCGRNVIAPVPLFLNRKNQPLFRLADVGSVIELAPLVQTYALARLPCASVGGEDISVMTFVVANWPR